MLRSAAVATRSLAPRSPVALNPPRAAVRRTTHIDITWAGAGLVLEGAARDLLTGRDARDGTARVLAEASLLARAGQRWELIELQLQPRLPAAGRLLGERVRSGFRAAVRSLLPEVSGSPVGVLLDDVPGAALISGYVNMRADLGAGRKPGGGLSAVQLEQMMSGICSGWRVEGSAIAAVRSDGSIPTQDCPVAPDLDSSEDPLAWHDMGPLLPGSMRRRRRIDIDPGETVEVDAMFRDTFGEPDGTEVVLHEYSLCASLAPSTLEVSKIEATPRVLPFGECPLAAPNVKDLVGARVGELRSVVPERLRKERCCTHLNDLLRVLSDIDWIVQSLPAAQAGPPRSDTAGQARSG
jgi:hypothetical protein